jgi:hypothetical protein
MPQNEHKKVLRQLSEAYNSVYNEGLPGVTAPGGDFKLSGEYHPSMEKGIKDHIAQIVNYITDNNIEVVSPHDGPSLIALGEVTEEVAPTMVSWFTRQYGLSNLARDVLSAMGTPYSTTYTDADNRMAQAREADKGRIGSTKWLER